MIQHIIVKVHHLCTLPHEAAFAQVIPKLRSVVIDGGGGEEEAMGVMGPK